MTKADRAVEQTWHWPRHQDKLATTCSRESHAALWHAVCLSQPQTAAGQGAANVPTAPTKTSTLLQSAAKLAHMSVGLTIDPVCRCPAGHPATIGPAQQQAGERHWPSS